MARWAHPFPSRTRKLSTAVAKVAPSGARIARRRAFFLYKPPSSLRRSLIDRCEKARDHRKERGRQLAGLGPGFFVPSPIYYIGIYRLRDSPFITSSVGLGWKRDRRARSLFLLRARAFRFYIERNWEILPAKAPSLFLSRSPISFRSGSQPSSS